jgi:hypothetical protein
MTRNTFAKRFKEATGIAFGYLWVSATREGKLVMDVAGFPSIYIDYHGGRRYSEEYLQAAIAAVAAVGEVK